MLANPLINSESMQSLCGYLWTEPDHHLFLPNDTIVKTKYKRVEYTASVHGGYIIRKGVQYTPQSFRMSITGIDAPAVVWRTLLIKMPDMREFRRAIDLRSTGPTPPGVLLPEHTRIGDIEASLSCRTARCLREEKLLTVGDVRKCSHGELLRIPSFGKKSLYELVQLGIATPIQRYCNWENTK